ncbi:oxidoreductase [Coriobacteriia bacterium Es71-Z0120]|uniref:complex I subunit 5 family protein n=1 Tax=Parvivirga hydrogeniphila TaxID=2939460 RepID=UPI002260EE92|nr:proton-conducting transporter membrane subunit [Parvivirga hydrogeniphila]MCL4078657.1 oxidoreductase [Parvivirga hydrogeniphila]
MDAGAHTSWVVPAAVFVPLLGGCAAGVSGAWPKRLRCGVLSAVAVLSVALTSWVLVRVSSGVTLEAHLVKMTPQIWIHLKVDALGSLYGVLAAVLWLLALAYSFGYMADEHRLPRYYAFFLLSLGWTVGVAYSGNLLTFLVFYELFSILTYPLVVHEQTPEALAAGTKYIVYILVGGSLVLLAIVYTYFLAGGQDIGRPLLDAGMPRAQLLAVFWCFIAGFGVKAALVPLHGWVPDAHPAAPAPFSAVLSGIMVATGTFGIMRVFFNVFGVELVRSLGVGRWVAYVAAFTVVFAALLAMNQDDIKRRLAYSTISQMGYVALGVALLDPQATTGAIVHVANHAFMKGALFFCAGLFIKRLGVRSVRELDGAAKRMPVTAAVLTIASLAMIGTPPLAGFVSKWYLGLGILHSGQVGYLVVLIGGALLAGVYLLPIAYRMYFKEPGPALPETLHAKGGSGEAPLTMLAPLVAAALIVILLGVCAASPFLPAEVAKGAVEAFFR